jgi:hypothetical protein
MNFTLSKYKGKIKGLFDTMPYTPLIEDGDSSPYFGTYEGQRYGAYDTQTCWSFAACELAETRLETLMKLDMIPDETMKWLKDNKYIDEDGDFYISRRWIAILSGTKDRGNYTMNFWEIAGEGGAGLIPNWMLPYSHKDARDEHTREDFIDEYFDPKVITKEMEEMGKEFAKRFKMQAESLRGGFLNNISTQLQTYLKEGTMHIGVPVPKYTWNQEYVGMPEDNTPKHAVELYKFDPTSDYPYYIYDSYEPHLKRLHKNYYIPIITRVLITPIKPKEVAKVTEWSKFWANVFAWLKGLSIPYPSVPVGIIK